MTSRRTLVGLATVLAIVVVAGLVAALLWEDAGDDATGPGTQSGPGTLVAASPRRPAGPGVSPAPARDPEPGAARPALPERLRPPVPERPRLGPEDIILRVVDAETGRPVTACALTVLPHLPGPTGPDELRARLEATPDRDTRPLRAVSGVYRLEGRPGTWDVIVQAPGYQTAAAPAWTLPARDHQPRSLELSRGPGISGRVFSIEGGAAPGILVHLHAAHLAPGARAPEARTMTTDDEGRFHFSPLPEGIYSVALHERDNMLDRYAGIRVEPGRTVRIEMILQPRVDAVVEVREPTGRPVPDAEIEVTSLDDPRRGVQARRSDDGGRATLSWLLPGSYLVVARRAGFAEGEARLELPAGQGVQFQTVVLERADG